MKLSPECLDSCHLIFHFSIAAVLSAVTQLIVFLLEKFIARNQGTKEKEQEYKSLAIDSNL